MSASEMASMGHGQFYKRLQQEGALPLRKTIDILEGLEQRRGELVRPISLESIAASGRLGKGGGIRSTVLSDNVSVAKKSTVTEATTPGGGVVSSNHFTANPLVSRTQILEDAIRSGDQVIELEKRNKSRTVNKLLSWFNQHRSAQIRASANAHKPGRRHTQATGRLVI